MSDEMKNKKILSFNETCRRLRKSLNMSEKDILEAIKKGELKTYVKRNGQLKRYSITNIKEDGEIEGHFLND